MRNAECGMRNCRARSSAATLATPFRIPHSAFRICLLLAACTPLTTRPDFFPYPEAPILILDARPERVTRELATLVPAESLRIERMNARDGYLETAWYDAKTGRSFAGARDLPDLPLPVRSAAWP